MVDHWHGTLARPDADGTWDYELMESPVLAEDWPTYQPFELPAVSLNYGLYPARESAEGNSGLARTTPAASWPGRTVAYPQAHLEAWTVAGGGTPNRDRRSGIGRRGGRGGPGHEGGWRRAAVGAVCRAR